MGYVDWEGAYSIRAGSGRFVSMRTAGCGRMSAKPMRRIAYAARIPKTIEPTVAHANMARFNRFTIISA